MSLQATYRLVPIRQFVTQNVGFHLLCDTFLPDGTAKISHGSSVQMDTFVEGSNLLDPKPTFSLTPAETQLLFDRLWTEGFRPLASQNEAAKIEAVNAHLQDMRAIAFDRLKVEKP